jgi:hypothetical protein
MRAENLSFPQCLYRIEFISRGHFADDRPFVLYESETWSFTLREASRLRVFENRVLTRTFRPNGEKVRVW